MNKIHQAKLVWALYQLLNETFIRHTIVWDYVRKEVKYLAHNKAILAVWAISLCRRHHEIDFNKNAVDS